MKQVPKYAKDKPEIHTPLSSAEAYAENIVRSFKNGKFDRNDNEVLLLVVREAFVSGTFWYAIRQPVNK